MVEDKPPDGLCSLYPPTSRSPTELIVGIFLSAASLPAGLSVEQLPSTGEALNEPSTLQALLPSPTQWQESLALFYYIKPNYPGRSSHLCNAGFVVPPSNRGLGLGGLAGRSFLHFAVRRKVTKVEPLRGRFLLIWLGRLRRTSVSPSSDTRVPSSI